MCAFIIDLHSLKSIEFGTAKDISACFYPADCSLLSRVLDLE